MRVLHLVGQSEDNGGILSVIRSLQESTARFGVRHVVWVREGFEQSRSPKLDLRFTRHLVSDSPSHLKLMVGAMRASVELRRLRAEEEFDLVHAHSRGGFLVGLQRSVTGVENILFTNHAYARRTGMYRMAAGRSRFFTVLLTQNMARHYGMEAGCGRVRIIPACCADRFFELPMRGERRDWSGGIRLVGVGNVVRWKAWDLVVEAMARLSKAEVGKIRFEHWGPVPRDEDSIQFERELKLACSRHGLESSVMWKGPTSRVELIFQEADWFVMPSTDEPCSVALMEALAAGIPVLATRSGGNVDLVRDGETGLLFQPGDAGDLAVKLKQILDGKIRIVDPASLRASVRDKSASTVGESYHRLYLELAGRGGA